MARFPTNVTRSVTVEAPLEKVYAYLADVVGSSTCIPGIDCCEANGADTYRFVFEERSTGPVSMVVQYTARYDLNGVDVIGFRSIDAPDDNTDADGEIRLECLAEKTTRITLRQEVAPETPVPRLVQGLIRSFVEGEAASSVEGYLDNVKRALEA